LIDPSGKSIRAGFSIIKSILSLQTSDVESTVLDVFIFFMRLAFVSARDGENGARFIKVNLVLLQVGLGFGVISFEPNTHRESISR
jgi:hypothetical protein